MSLDRGTTTRPRPTKIYMPSHKPQVPSIRFSGIAMMRPASRSMLPRIEMASRALSTPTTMTMLSSMYVCAAYSRS